jgi:hypothetical protein
MVRVAIFEDKPGIVLGIQRQLAETGPHEIETAGRLSDSLALVAEMALRDVEQQPDFLLVDGNLDQNDEYHGGYGPAGYTFSFPRSETITQAKRSFWKPSPKEPLADIFIPYDYTTDGSMIIRFVRALQQHPKNPTLLGAKIIGISENKMGEIVDYDLTKQRGSELITVMHQLQQSE